MISGDVVFEEHLHGVSEDDGIGNLHHGCLEVQRGEETLLSGLGEGAFVKGHEGRFSHHGTVEDFTDLKRGFLFEDEDGAVVFDQFDANGACGLGGERRFVAEKVAFGHCGDVGAGGWGPRAHGMWVFTCVVFYGFWRAAIGVPFAEDGVDGGSEHFGVAGAGVFFSVRLRVFGELGERESLGLEFCDGGFQLGDGSADIGKLDDVGFGFEGQRSEFGEGVRRFLVGWEKVRKVGEDASGEGDVARFDGDAGVFGKRLDDGEKGLGSECGCFVRDGVDDGGGVGHGLRGLVELMGDLTVREKGGQKQ